MRFWPFLVAANPTLDYRVILCPDFIESSGRRELFRYIDLPSSANGTIQLQEVDDDQLGRMLIFFRSTRVCEGSGDVYDAAGRPFFRYEGIVIRATREDRAVDGAVAERAINQALSEMDKVFTSFWTATTRPSTTLSKQQYLGLDAPPPEPPPPKPPLPEPPPIALTKAQWIFALCLLAVSLVGNAAFFSSYYDLAGKVSTVQASIADMAQQIVTLSKDIDELRRKLEEARK
jgi:hypothetical protein